ncbi:MAG: hypothetical protein ACSHX6_05580 [Akkermansiaceae bacterium]
MTFSSRINLLKALIIIPLFVLLGSLQAAEYSIIDPEDLITEDQRQILKKGQTNISADQNTLVSYAFYNVNNTKVGSRMNWESALEKAAKEGNTSNKFHVLICVGIFSRQHTIDIFYKNQPALEDVNELSICISSLKQSLASEPDTQDLIENAADIIKGRLSYLNERPKYEEKKKQTAADTRTQEFITYIYHLVKIGLLIIVPIIALLIFWFMMCAINNRRPHRFPTSKYASPKKRLGAPHAATSISKNSN